MVMARKTPSRDEVLKALLVLQRNVRWVFSHPEKFKGLEGRFVAVHNHRILEVSDDDEELEAKYGSLPVYIHYVWPPNLVQML